MNDGRSHDVLNAIVRVFLNSNLSLILVVLSAALGIAALAVTPREEDPQIVVPMADVFVEFPGRSAADVEQLVATPLEKLLYQIDGVEYVYSMSQRDRAIVTVRFYVGEDRERSLVKLRKRIDENLDTIPLGVSGWVVKPVEIDDAPIVTLTLTSATADEFALRRVAEELVDRFASVENTSRAYVVGGQPRKLLVRLDPQRLEAYGVAPLGVQGAIQAANAPRSVGAYTRDDQTIAVGVGPGVRNSEDLRNLVVGVFAERPVFLKDVATVVDGPDEADSYVRHGWGPARSFPLHDGAAGSAIASRDATKGFDTTSSPAVTIAIAKKKGSNAVWVAEEVLQKARRLTAEIVPDDVDVVVTRNSGLTANEKVNELVEALAVAILIVIALLTVGLGWREALIVAVAVPVVFGLTMTVNLLFGYTINRVTLFALILSLGLLVDDPIVDVENIARHFKMRRKATRQIVLEAIAEIRPPLITATLAVIVSFLPLFFITGMMGPYMAPMALNVPVTMLMSMFVAFTITPWLAYHVLKRRMRGQTPTTDGHDEEDAKAIRSTPAYRFFAPILAPLLRSRVMSWGLLALMGVLMAASAGLAAYRAVPLKMLPFDNKNNLLLVLDFDESTTLERSDAVMREIEQYVAQVPEVVDFTSYVGLASPMDFNGLVRHYYLRRGPNVAELRMNFVGKKSRAMQSHALGLRLHDDLTAIARRHGAVLSVVELPPGPPVIKTLVAEVRGGPDSSYDEIMAAAETVRARLEREPGVVDIDVSAEADSERLTFAVDKEKALLNGVTLADISATLETALTGAVVSVAHAPGERNPLLIEARFPRDKRSSPADLSRVMVKGATGVLAPLSELGKWETSLQDKTIYHKNLQRLAYVFAETAGRPPADAVLDIQADFTANAAPPDAEHIGPGWVATDAPRAVAQRSFLANGGGVQWFTPGQFDVDFAGEGEWKITLDVFRDLGLAFAAALVGIYILLVGQMRSFGLPLVIMLAIPLTVIGIMPGFWLLNALFGADVGGYPDPVFFTATGMIGMIALAGIVTRQAVIIVDFIHLSLRRGQSLRDAIIDSCAVRLRPILLTVGTAMLSAAPIVIDPIFSGLAWALIFGLFASTAFTLLVIPVTYWLIYANRPGHGLNTPDLSE